MNLGQSLTALLALVLFTTITLSINRARISATEQTIDHQIELEAFTYGQSLMETVSTVATSESGYADLENIFYNNRDFRTIFAQGSGKPLYGEIEVVTSAGFIELGIPYKKVIVSVYRDESLQEQYLKSRYKATFSRWW